MRQLPPILRAHLLDFRHAQRFHFIPDSSHFFRSRLLSLGNGPIVRRVSPLAFSDTSASAIRPCDLCAERARESRE